MCQDKELCKQKLAAKPVKMVAQPVRIYSQLQHSYLGKMYKRRAEVTINLRYLTYKEFSKPFSSDLLFLWYLNNQFSDISNEKLRFRG